MKPLAQNIAIAEACGWTAIHADKDGTPWGQDPVNKMPCVTLPDYLNDLNAIAQAKKIPSRRQRDTYAVFLGDITGGRQIDWGSTKINATTEILFATAAQECEAFLHVLNLWTDESKKSS